MFDFFKPKTPAKFLKDTQLKLSRMGDQKKIKFLEKNLSAIIKAMWNDPQDVTHYQSPTDQAKNIDAQVTQESAAGYLYWYYPIFANLRHEGEPLEKDKLSPEARLFFFTTQADTISAFEKLFTINPVEAIESLDPHELFIETIKDALHTLVSHDDPQLFFDCVDAVSFRGNHKTKTEADLRFRNTITCLTKAALENLLEKDPQKFSSHRYDWDYPGSEDYYIDYLPEGKVRQFFVQDHIQEILSAVRNNMPNVADKNYGIITKLINTFPDDIRPKKLDTLRESVVSKSIKEIFTLAADPTHPNLSELIRKISSSEINSGLIRSTGKYDESGDRKPYNLFCLTNPDSLPDAKDSDLGKDSQYIWVVTDERDVLAASFTAAGLRGFLQHQRQIPLKEMPSIAEFDQFVGIKSLESV